MRGEKKKNKNVKRLLYLISPGEAMGHPFPLSKQHQSPRKAEECGSAGTSGGHLVYPLLMQGLLELVAHFHVLLGFECLGLAL